MNTKQSIGVAIVIALLVLSNYATFWATTQVNQIKVLEEQLDKYEQIAGQQAALLTDGPSK